MAGAAVLDHYQTPRTDVHRVIFVHCDGLERQHGNSPYNAEQASVCADLLETVAIRHVRDELARPSVLVLTPYRGQVTTIRGLRHRDVPPAQVMTIDGAQGQEAELVVISMVRANPQGRVGFTDDARRLNVAITRARRGVVIVGHLPTMLAATSSGFPTLLDDLHERGCIFRSQLDGRRRVIVALSDRAHQELVQQAGEVREADERGAPKVHLKWAEYTIPRAPDGDVPQTIAALATSARRHIVALTASGSFLAAMAHSSALKPRTDWAAGNRPDDVFHWDRKSLSHENFLTHQGLDIDCGNKTLGIMFLALRQALTVDPPSDERDRRPLPLGCSPGDMDCQAHPVLTASVTPGYSWREGPTLSVTLLLTEDIPRPRCLQMVIATLLPREPQQQTSRQKPQIGRAHV